MGDRGSLPLLRFLRSRSATERVMPGAQQQQGAATPDLVVETPRWNVKFFGVVATLWNGIDMAMTRGAPYLRYGFAPVVILLGLRNSPNSSIWDVISPM